MVRQRGRVQVLLPLQAAMNALRDAGDAIEFVVPSNDWPLPTYREMLFIK